MADEATPGWKTSEFWLTLIFVAFACGCAGLELYRGKLGLEAALVIAAAAVAKTGYTVSRGMVKSSDLSPEPRQDPNVILGPITAVIGSVTELLKAKSAGTGPGPEADTEPGPSVAAGPGSDPATKQPGV